MSVTSHYTGCYVLDRHFSSAMNFRWLVVGSAFPDALVFDRVFMYAIDMKKHRDYFSAGSPLTQIAEKKMSADDPAFHNITWQAGQNSLWRWYPRKNILIFTERAVNKCL
ncbi:MAG: hypothetical protein PHV36_07125 [Elusimicrobiales bacterium]|nr:hypothetical protein [Elusimicrobiales bacterium]